MHKFFNHLLAATLCLVGCTPSPRPQAEIKSWAVYYDDALPASDFKKFDLVVFDRQHHPDLKPLKKGKTKVLAYVSIGEVHDHAPVKQALIANNAILFQNDKWGSHAVDVRSPLWKKTILDQVKDAKKRGFDGVMLDTIDSPLHWAENKGKQEVESIQDAAADLIHEIRRKHPGMKLMVNRGFAILPLIAHDIDYVLAESIFSKTDVSTGQFELFPPITYAQVAEQLRDAAANARQLQVFTLDYWNPDDVNGLERIYAAQRAKGFIPYVTTPDLRSLTPVPPPNTRNT